MLPTVTDYSVCWAEGRALQFKSLRSLLHWSRGIHPPKPMMHIAYFHKMYVFLLNLHFLLPSYFDHDAFLHHALHVLGAPALKWLGQLLHPIPPLLLLCTSSVLQFLSKFQCKLHRMHASSLRSSCSIRTWTSAISFTRPQVSAF